MDRIPVRWFEAYSVPPNEMLEVHIGLGSRGTVVYGATQLLMPRRESGALLTIASKVRSCDRRQGLTKPQQLRSCRQERHLPDPARFASIKEGPLKTGLDTPSRGKLQVEAPSSPRLLTG